MNLCQIFGSDSWRFPGSRLVARKLSITGKACGEQDTRWSSEVFVKASNRGSPRVNTRTHIPPWAGDSEVLTADRHACPTEVVWGQGTYHGAAKCHPWFSLLQVTATWFSGGQHGVLGVKVPPEHTLCSSLEHQQFYGIFWKERWILPHTVSHRLEKHRWKYFIWNKRMWKETTFRSAQSGLSFRYINCWVEDITNIK